MKINFWYNEGCEMWRWTITNEFGQSESFSCKNKVQAMNRLFHVMAVLTKGSPVER